MNSIRTMMSQAGCPPSQVERFVKRVEQFLSGEKAQIREQDIQPVESLPGLKELNPVPELLSEVAVVKLNGGLGTSMGLTGPKGLLEVKDGRDFYQILHSQVQVFRAKSGFQPPLIFMNSFNTEAETEERLRGLGFEQGLPWGFRQSQVPKIKPDGTLPEVESEYAWCPPGHGDIYASLLDAGLKERLLEAGIRYLFVSNIDNLGAVLDSRPLGYMRENGLAFLMEVTRRGENDRKGGHLAYDSRGRLILREVAQCPDQDMDRFQDIERHRFFNTNNLWIDLSQISESWTDLPLIVNRKPVKPHQPDSQRVVQLEQAMGAAIGVVKNTGALEVGRDRFLPVKTTNDLLLIRSDLYRLDDDYNLVSSSRRLPKVSLDPRHYKLIRDFERLVPSVPSLKDVLELAVDGPVELHKDMSLEGKVHLKA